MILGLHFQKITSLVPQVSAIGSFGPWMYKFGKCSFKVLGLLVIGKIGPLEHFGEFQFQSFKKSDLSLLVLGLIYLQNQINLLP